MPFRKSDARRVQALFDEAVTAPYEAEVTLSNANAVMTISVADPDNAALNVVTCSFDYNPAPAVRTVDQPRAQEVMEQCAVFATACSEYQSPA